MTPTDAAKLLDLPADSTPEQIESRFLELRRKLEDKIAKAPTPGLQAKYRESLAEITTAFETLTAAADSSSLPVASKQRTEDGGQRTDNVGSPLAATSPNRSAQAPTLHSKPKSGGKEFLLVATIAVLVLGVGGWFVMKTRAETAEKARVAAEQKAEAERAAVAAKEQAERDRLAKETAATAEKERLDRLFISLRSRMAEYEVAYDAAMRAESTAERTLGDLRTLERETGRPGAKPPTPAARALALQTQAQSAYLDWLRDTLPAHPARVARARAVELVAARAADAAPEAVAAFGDALGRLQDELARRAPDLEAVAAGITAGPILAEWRKVIEDGKKADADFSAMMARSRPNENTAGYQRLDADRDLALFVIERFEKNPKNIPPDFPAAVVWLEKTATQGDLRATRLMAEMYASSSRVPSDEEKMWIWLGKAAEIGDSDTKFDVATKGRYQMLPWDLGTKVRWLRAAAEAGHAGAQLALAGYGGWAAPEPLLAGTIEETRQQAAAGGFFAQLELRAWEEKGKVFVSEEEAVKWLRKAAAQGHPAAVAELKARNLTP